MLLRPKIATASELNTFVFPEYHNFEIQTLGRIGGVPEYLKELQQVLLRHNSTQEFTVHLPPCEVGFEYLWAYAQKDLDAIIHYAQCLAPVRVNILFHIYSTPTDIIRMGAWDYLSSLLDTLQGTNVTLLFENTLLNMNDDLAVESAAAVLVKMANNEHLGYCLDLCHHQINMRESWGMHLHSKDIVPLTKQIHFSATLNNDGYRDTATHGRCHQSVKHLQSDLQYLTDLGYDINKVPLVLEINEEDYVKRPDLRRELDLFRELRRTSNE